MNLVSIYLTRSFFGLAFLLLFQISWTMEPEKSTSRKNFHLYFNDAKDMFTIPVADQLFEIFDKSTYAVLALKNYAYFCKDLFVEVKDYYKPFNRELAYSGHILSLYMLQDLQKIVCKHKTPYNFSFFTPKIFDWTQRKIDVLSRLVARNKK